MLDPQGFDAGKKISDRKRHILVDTLGLLLSVAVHAANIQDRDGMMLVLDRRTGRLFPFIERRSRHDARQRQDDRYRQSAQVVEARSASDIDAAFADAKRQSADAVIVGAGPFFRIRRAQLVVQGVPSRAADIGSRRLVPTADSCTAAIRIVIRSPRRRGQAVWVALRARAPWLC
jgi:hypothetical protein